MQKYKKNWLKFAIGFLSCLFVRLLPFRPPNIEPILATAMPFSKAYGRFFGFFFAFLSIIFYDLVTGTLGSWTIITSLTYGVLGFLAFWYFKNRKASAINFAIFAVFGTLFFDVVTGLSIGPLFFHKSLRSAALGQIPFTLWHLLGNVSFSLILSPALYRFVIENKKFENVKIINSLKAKQA
jgi:uncharacterized membrane protein